jgi:hypothetical protein
MRERAARLLDERPQAVARVVVERAEHLVELHRRGGVRQRDRASVAQLRSRRRARPQVDVEVALQEQVRADLQRRVAMDRPALVVDRHLDDRGRPRPGLDLRDLADVDARDPHGRAAAQLVGRLHDRVERVPVAERQRPAERQVHDGPDDREHEHAGAEGRHCGPSGVPGGGAVSSVRLGCRPAGWPMCWPGR